MSLVILLLFFKFTKLCWQVLTGKQAGALMCQVKRIECPDFKEKGRRGYITMA